MSSAVLRFCCALFRELCDMVHHYGGQVYLDGANMNAQVKQPLTLTVTLNHSFICICTRVHRHACIHAHTHTHTCTHTHTYTHTS